MCIYIYIHVNTYLHIYLSLYTVYVQIFTDKIYVLGTSKSADLKVSSLRAYLTQNSRDTLPSVLPPPPSLLL